jgi:hypothetical protein
MSADRLSREEELEASRQARRIQSKINTAIDRHLVRCVAPLKVLRSRNVSGTDEGSRYGIELRVEPLVTIADFSDEPARQIAATLRGWAALLSQAAASLE